MGRKKADSARRKLTPEQYGQITKKLFAKWEREGIDQFLHPPRPEPKRRKRGLTKNDAEAAKRRTGAVPRPTEPASGLKRADAGGQSRLEYLAGFFRAAGVGTEIGPAGRLRINGSQTQPLAHLPSPDTAEWINIVNEIALKYARDEFIRAIEDNARFDDGLRLSLQPRERGFVIMRGDVRLGVIHPAHAFLPHRPFIRANFLTSGPHWRQVADVIHDTEAKREQDAKVPKTELLAVKVERRRADVRRRIDELPNDLVPELVGDCLNASRRIRLERQVAYERPVVLERDVGELTLLPITRSQTRLLMPFRLSKGTETLEGELLLSDHDPLPLLIGRHVAARDAIAAWICALLGFADATCIDFEPTARHQPTRQRRPPSSISGHRHTTRTLPRRQAWPAHLEPVGPWVHYSGSFVAGHRRHLNDGQTASDEARDRARQVGIVLHPHETWVRPHARGVPDGIEMRFRWHRSF